MVIWKEQTYSEYLKEQRRTIEWMLPAPKDSPSDWLPKNKTSCHSNSSSPLESGHGEGILILERDLHWKPWRLPQPTVTFIECVLDSLCFLYTECHIVHILPQNFCFNSSFCVHFLSILVSDFYTKLEIGQVIFLDKISLGGSRRQQVQNFLPLSN